MKSVVAEVAEKYALLNALEYGKANEKAVVGKIIAELPEAKGNMKAVLSAAKEAVRKVNSLSREEIEKLAAGLRAPRKKEEKRELPELPVEGKPVFRIAPNPNGPLHIGHARMVILNHEYCKKYSGKLILRFDDTDPKNPSKRPVKEAYEMIREDLKWLGVEWDTEIIASKRLKIYYEWFEKCLEEGIAYVCTCEPEKWRKKVRMMRKPCECRDRAREENLELGEKMLSGELGEGMAVGRIKTPLDEKDPAVLEWVAMRIVDNPVHPFYPENPPKVWPTLDFASAIDDMLCGVTHIIRGKDLAVCEKRQRILFHAMKKDYPFVAVFGKIFSEKFVLSTSRMREGVEKGIYSGFDDPKLPTLRAFRKRGIVPEAVRNYILSLGLNESESVFDEKILFAENRKIVDSRAKRFFAVSEPMEVKLENLRETVARAPLYPDKSKYREIPVKDRVFVEKDDFEKFRGREVRFMHLCNAVLGKTSRVTGMEPVPGLPKIHWVPEEFSTEIELVLPGEEKKCVAEKNVENVKSDEIVQFERLGFARCEKPGVFYYAHR